MPQNANKPSDRPDITAMWGPMDNFVTRAPAGVEGKSKAPSVPPIEMPPLNLEILYSAGPHIERTPSKKVSGADDAFVSAGVELEPLQKDLLKTPEVSSTPKQISGKKVSSTRKKTVQPEPAPAPVPILDDAVVKDDDDEGKAGTDPAGKIDETDWTLTEAQFNEKYKKTGSKGKLAQMIMHNNLVGLDVNQILPVNRHSNCHTLSRVE